MRPDPTAAALAIAAERYPAAAVVFLAGSVLRGEGTETSDLDLVVVHERVDAAYRESFLHEGWPVEAFVHDPETLRYFFEQDARAAGVPSLADMVANGVPLPRASERAAALKALAAATLAAGPPQWTEAELAASRYAVTNLVDDLKSPRSRAELAATAATLYPALATHFLRARGLWSATAKTIPRRLAAVDPSVAERFVQAFAAVLERRETAVVIRLASDVLEPDGGWLFAGYKAVAPREWRTSGDGPAVTLVVSLWLAGGDVAAFESFEQRAAEVMAPHGGRIASVVRCGGGPDEPFEVHVVTFPSAAALKAYREDPRQAELRAQRERVIARTEVWSGDARSPYGARP
jgi:uncharacterized protein (DUF1330 family)